MNRGAWIAIVIIALIVVGIVIYNFALPNEPITSTGQGQPSISEYNNLQTSDDDFASIDEALNYLG